MIIEWVGEPEESEGKNASAKMVWRVTACVGVCFVSLSGGSEREGLTKGKRRSPLSLFHSTPQLGGRHFTNHHE
jgi:hypothetical protein